MRRPARPVHGRVTAATLAALTLALAHSLSFAAEPAEPDEGEAQEIIVTATPLPSSPEELARAVEIVTREELDASGATSAAGALERLTWVSVSERGGRGGAVQADLSMRGSTFQQVLVAVDGLPVTDSQTAHHNMDLPFGLRALGQIQVIPGPGSALFGPSALAGTVNFVTAVPERSGVSFLASTGSFDLGRFEAVADSVSGPVANTFAAAYERSDGFRSTNDYETWSVWNSSVFSFEGGKLRISAGHVDKEFRADDFYVPFPSWELTATTLVDVAPEFALASGWRLNAIARYRRHDDEFLIPGFSYRNRHTTETLTERVVLTSPRRDWGAFSLGLQRSDDSISSNNLGYRDDFTNSAFTQGRFGTEGRWNVDVGLRADDHSGWGTEFSPSVAASVAADETLTLRLAAGRGIRPPSYTELFYVDPNNIGNSALEPEYSWGGEAGFDLKARGGRGGGGGGGDAPVAGTYF